MKEGVLELGKIDNIVIYYDKYQKDTEFILGIKEDAKLNRPGYYRIPSCWLESTVSPGEHSLQEINSEYRKPILENMRFIVGGSSDVEFYKKVI